MSFRLHNVSIKLSGQYKVSTWVLKVVNASFPYISFLCFLLWNEKLWINIRCRLARFSGLACFSLSFHSFSFPYNFSPITPFIKSYVGDASDGSCRVEGCYFISILSYSLVWYWIVGSHNGSCRVEACYFLFDKIISMVH